MSDWNAKVERILADVRRESRNLLILGMSLYFLCGALVLWVVGDRPLSGVVVMGFFQVMVIYMATDRIYRCIKGSFLVMLAAQEDTMPVFERLNESAGKLQRLADQAGSADSELARKAERVFREEMDRLRAEIRGSRERTERDVDDALAEGEREAAAILADAAPLCPRCGHAHDDGAGPDCEEVR